MTRAALRTVAVWTLAHAAVAVATNLLWQPTRLQSFAVLIWPYDPCFAPAALVVQAVLLSRRNGVRPFVLAGCTMLFITVVLTIVAPLGSILLFVFFGSPTWLAPLVFATITLPSGVVLAGALWLLLDELRVQRARQLVIAQVIGMFAYGLALFMSGGFLSRSSPASMVASAAAGGAFGSITGLAAVYVRRPVSPAGTP